MTSPGPTLSDTADDARPTPGAPPAPPFWTTGIAAIAAAKLAMHVVTIVVTPYGIHRDEFLYAAMGRYLRLFAMDFPPFIAILAEAARAAFGDTLFALRIAPALAGTALVVLAALIARTLGGGRLAQAAAALAVLGAPLFLRAAALFQPVVFDQLWWTLALYALVRIGRDGAAGDGAPRVGVPRDGPTRAGALRHGAPRDWLLLGVAGGLGLLTKFTIGFIAIGILVALVAIGPRRAWRTRWPYVAGAVALLIGSPSIVGQVALGFPVSGQMADLQAQQLARVTPAGFLSGQLFMIGPAILLAVGGILAVLTPRPAAGVRMARPAVVACLTAVVLLVLAQGKEYYAGPVYPTLFAAGAVALERAGRAAKPLAVGLVGLVLAFMLVALPLGLPILPAPRMTRYAAWLGLTRAVVTNRGEVLPLPQDYADMLGWEEQVEAVARAYHDLPADDRRRAVILANNYGEAGALDWFGPRHGLPRAVSNAGSYWFFGPGDRPGDVAVGLGIEPEGLAEFYAEITVVDRVANRWGVPEQQDNPVIVARGPARSLQEVWPELAGRN